MCESLRDVYSRDVVSFPLVINGYKVSKGVRIGEFNISLDVQKVVKKRIHRFFVVVKSTDSEPSLEREYIAEVNRLREGLGVHVYLAVVNDLTKEIALSKELVGKMTFPDEDYSIKVFSLPPGPSSPDPSL